ncbi:MAG TPA: hypothetical protein DCE56_16590, partial [Cyanobacteria bacterium UBA8553]|nr:hypothetical protein [Cyanobacteria bacterium UBA8553]
MNPNLDGMVPQLSMPPSTLPERPLPPSPSTNLPIDRYPIPPSGAAMTQIPPSGEPLLQTPQATALAPSPSQRNVTDNSSSSDRNNLAFINKLGDWSKRHQTNDPKRLDISGNYPERVGAVGGPNSGIVSVAVKVEPNGKIDSNTLEVIGSNVSNDVFDREAEAAVRRHQFPATGKVEYYSVNVQFNNSNTSTLKSPTQLQPPVALPNSAGLLNLPKLSNPTTAPRSTITGTPAQNLMEKLRRNLTNTSPSSPTD